MVCATIHGRVAAASVLVTCGLALCLPGCTRLPEPTSPRTFDTLTIMPPDRNAGSRLDSSARQRWWGKPSDSTFASILMMWGRHHAGASDSALFRFLPNPWISAPDSRGDSLACLGLISTHSPWGHRVIWIYRDGRIFFSSLRNKKVITGSLGGEQVAQLFHFVQVNDFWRLRNSYGLPYNAIEITDFIFYFVRASSQRLILVANSFEKAPPALWVLAALMDSRIPQLVRWDEQPSVPDAEDQ